MLEFLFSKTPAFKKIEGDKLKSLFKGKNILVVGGTAGIGKSLATACLDLGANVSIVGRRQPDESLKAARFIQKDLSVLKNASDLVGEIGAETLDIMVFTNGIITSPQRQVSPDGIELDLAVSYLSRFTILQKIASLGGIGSKRKDKTFVPRIFIMGYPGKPIKAHNLDDFNWEKKYEAWNAHTNTVIGNEILVSLFAERLGGPSKACLYGLNPGLIFSEIRDNFLGKGTWLSWIAEGAIKSLFQSSDQYARNVLVQLLVSSDLNEQNKGLFESDGSLLAPNPEITDEVKEKVIKESEALINRVLN